MADYDSATWIELIENELNYGRPVFYTGQDTGAIGGHAWACDGYDANGLLHMNWGWGGKDNGYFLISNLNTPPYNWSWTETAIIGIQPPSYLAIENVGSELGLRVFPNPADKYVDVEMGGQGDYEFDLLNLTGQVIDRKETAQGGVFDVEGLVNGVYVLRVIDRNNAGRIFTRKVVVGH
jgi:hypothetical protein